MSLTSGIIASFIQASATDTGSPGLPVAFMAGILTKSVLDHLASCDMVNVCAYRVTGTFALFKNAYMIPSTTQKTMATSSVYLMAPPVCVSKKPLVSASSSTSFS